MLKINICYTQTHNSLKWAPPKPTAIAKSCFYITAWRMCTNMRAFTCLLDAGMVYSAVSWRWQILYTTFHNVVNIAKKKKEEKKIRRSKIELDEQIDRLDKRAARMCEGKGRLEMRGLSTFSCISPNSRHTRQESHCLSLSLYLFLSFFFVLLSQPDRWQNVERWIKEKRCREMEGKQIVVQNGCVNFSKLLYVSICICIHGCPYCMNT